MAFAHVTLPSIARVCGHTTRNVCLKCRSFCDLLVHIAYRQLGAKERVPDTTEPCASSLSWATITMRCAASDGVSSARKTAKPSGVPLLPGTTAATKTAAANAPLAKVGKQKSECKNCLTTTTERCDRAEQLRAVLGVSAWLCKTALQSHNDDMERAANWLLEQGEGKGGDGGGKGSASDASGSTIGKSSGSDIKEAVKAKADRVAAKDAARAGAERVAAEDTNRNRLARGWACWLELARKRKSMHMIAHVQKLIDCSGFAAVRMAAVSFSTWHALWAELACQRESMRRALNHMLKRELSRGLNRSLARGWACWHALWLELARKRKSMHMIARVQKLIDCSGFVAVRMAAVSFSTWHALWAELACQRESMRRALNHMLKHELSRGWAVWSKIAAARTMFVQKLCKGLSFMANRKAALGFSTWCERTFAKASCLPITDKPAGATKAAHNTTHNNKHDQVRHQSPRALAALCPACGLR